MPRIFRFFGNAASNSAGYAIGTASGTAMSPIVQELQNETWEKYPNVPIDVAILADGVATGEIDYGYAVAEAKRTGFNKSRFDKLVDVADRGIAQGDAFTLWRRGKLTRAQWERAIKRQGIEDEWVDALADLRNGRLSPEVIANAVQQGFLPDDGLLPGMEQGAPPFTPPTEQVSLDATDQAAASGVPSDQLRVLAQLSGNPPGPAQLLEMWRRGIITEEGVNRGIREGRTKTKWIPALKALRWHVLSAEKAAALRVKGWITEDEAAEIGEQNGYDRAAMERLYLATGRPATTRQVWIGLKRGGKLEGQNLDERETFRQAVKQSNIRPEYEPLLWASRYTYPSAFALRGLVSTKAISAAEGAQILEYQGWEPALAAKVTAAWAGDTDSAEKEATATDELTLYDGERIDRAELLRRLEALGYSRDDANRKADVLDARRVVAARTVAITAIRTSFVKQEISESEAGAALDRVGVSSWAQDKMLELWDAARDITRAELTLAEIQRAYRRSLITLDAASAELRSRGYSADEASVLLGLTVPTLTVKQVQDAFKAALRTREEAAQLLSALGYTAKDIPLLLGEVDKSGDAAKILEAFKGGTLAEGEAVTQLVDLGYSEAAATAYLHGE